MSIAVVIPSKKADNLVPCVKAVAANEPDAQIIVVDDGLAHTALGPIWDRIDLMPGVKPFIFSRNVNLGAKEALADSDCEGFVILGDDGLLETRGGFSTLATASKEHPEYGLMASTCSNVGNLNQHPKGIGLRDEPRVTCFVCVYIPRSTWNTVGELDEAFGGPGVYGHEDDDYCYRVRRAGLKLGIHDGCFVEHGKLKSTFRDDPTQQYSLEPGRAIFTKKWGAYPL